LGGGKMRPTPCVLNLAKTKSLFLFYCGRRLNHHLKEFLKFLLGFVCPRPQLSIKLRAGKPNLVLFLSVHEMKPVATLGDI
jgi:hypothetical protein